MADEVLIVDLATGKETRRPLSAAEIADRDQRAQQATQTRQRDTARAANVDTIRQRLTAYLALPTPTPAQNAKAIKALARLALALTDDVSDTA